MVGYILIALLLGFVIGFILGATAERDGDDNG